MPHSQTNQNFTPPRNTLTRDKHSTAMHTGERLTTDVKSHCTTKDTAEGAESAASFSSGNIYVTCGAGEDQKSQHITYDAILDNLVQNNGVTLSQITTPKVSEMEAKGSARALAKETNSVYFKRAF